MADISLFEDDYEDSGGDGSDGYGYQDYDSYNPDDQLSPIQKMEKYMDSENIFSRQMVARNIMDTLRWVVESDADEDAAAVLAALARLSEDPEPTVRAELMDQIPHLAMYCHENNDIFGSGIAVIPNYVLPVICKYLTDFHIQVRKTSQAALLVLLEQELIDKDDFEEQVCPVLLDITSPDGLDDLRIEAVALMSKMAPLVGQDITVRVFMHRYAELCTDAIFHVRKVCAANFGDMCTYVGQENAESFLIPKFKLLCEDRVWGVRKACAECFMGVSCCVSQEFRVRELSNLFLQLIRDQSRWVTMAAFQALGGFISTFADANNTGLYFNEHGVLVAGNQDQQSRTQSPSQSSPEKSSNSSEQSQTQSVDSEKTSPSTDSNTKSENTELNTKSENVDSNKNSASSENKETGEKSTEICTVKLNMENADSNTKLNAKSNTSDIANCDISAAVNPVIEEPPTSPGETSAPGSYSHDDNTLQDMDIDEASTEANNRDGAASSEISPEESRAQHLETSGKMLDNSAGASSNSNSEKADVANEMSRLSVTDGAGTESGKSEPVHIHIGHIQNMASFNQFQYWREPLPEIDLEFDLVNGQPTNVQLVAKKASPTHCAKEAAENTESQNAEDKSVFMASVSSLDEEHTVEYVANIGSTHVLGQHVSESTMKVVNGVVQADIGSPHLQWETVSSEDELGEENNRTLEPECKEQDVIPQALLDHYLSMTDPHRAQNIDQDIARHCAFSLPAVAYTLGKQYWPCLQDLYETLASDMQWKVRRTLAFSIHELAVIVGEEITHNDLVPVFDGFLKDLDEVRIGVLKHFADFLRLLRYDKRREYLTKIQGFLNVDNNRNWRFREELASQLILLTELFSPEEGNEHLLPVALLLAEDKVSEVRQVAFKVLATILRRFASQGEGNNKLVAVFIADIIPRFAHSFRWNQRQIFAQLCDQILEEQSLSNEQFVRDLLPELLTLANDSIPNVRLAVAKVLSAHILRSEYFTSPNNPEHERLLSTQQRLQSDKDRDVRYFIQTNHANTNSFDDQMIPV